MDENKNFNIGSSSNADTLEYGVRSTPDTIRDHDNADELFYDDYIYDEFYYESICISCQHWNGYMCNAENGNCDYTPF